MGEKIRLSDYIIKVINVDIPYTEYGILSQSRKGVKLIAIEVAYENKTNRILSFGQLDWTLFDDSGYSYSSYYDQSKIPSLALGNLNPGNKVRGWIVFEILNQSKNYKVQFSNSYLGRSNAEIQLY